MTNFKVIKNPDRNADYSWMVIRNGERVGGANDEQTARWLADIAQISDTFEECQGSQ